MSSHRTTDRPGGTATPASSLPGSIASVSSNVYGTTNHIGAVGSTPAPPRPHKLGYHGQVYHSSTNGSVNHLSGSSPGSAAGRQGRKTIYDRSLNRSRTAELSQASFAYLFMEMVAYAQRRPKDDVDLEQALNSQGYPIGIRLLDLLLYRTTSTSTSTSSTVPPPKTRPTKVLSLLQFIHTTLWRHLFGRHADALEKSSSNATEYMITDADQLVNRFISVPADSSQLNCAAFVAGIIEGVCDAAGFPTEGVTAHWVTDDDDRDGSSKTNVATVQGKTVFVIRFKKDAIVQ